MLSSISSKDQIERNVVHLKYIPTSNMAAEIFTKLLPKPKFQANQKMLGMHSQEFGSRGSVKNGTQQ